MVRYKYKQKREEAWVATKQWDFPTGLHPDSEEELTRRKSRLPLSEELTQKRKEHMQALYKEIKSYALIGRLYKMDRSIVRKIINDLI